VLKPHGYVINIGLSMLVGLVFAGAQNDDVIRSDLPWWGFAGALLLQEALLVQWISRDKNTAFENRIIGPLAKHNVRLKFLAMPFVVALCIGLGLLVFSPRPMTIGGIARVACVAICLALCADPLIGLIDKPPVALLGAGLIYITLLYGAVSNYHSTTDALAEAIPVVASKGLVVGVFCYLILSSRWTYYQLFCYEEMDKWVRSALDVFIPFSLLGIGLLPTVVQTLQLLFLGM
jgi:hypothetical protein